ncbi:MAG: AAA family ATPase [Bacillota bacterium]
MHLTRVAIFPELFPTEEFYPFNLPVFKSTRRIDFKTPVTFFVGENGTGKSTMLKAIAQHPHLEGPRPEAVPVQPIRGRVLQVHHRRVGR